MKISASIYSNRERSLEETVREADLLHIDYLHVDCNDEMKVFQDIAQVRTRSRTPIDLHLITQTPERYYDLVESNAVELLTLQHELLGPRFRFPDRLRSRLGIAITSQTPVSAFDHYAEDCGFILFMTTQPGKSGGKFDQETFQRIRDFKHQHPEKRIHVDGGVNDDVAFALKTLGVHCAVSGSFLVCASSMARALMSLQGRTSDQQVPVREFMRSLHETPCIHEAAVTLRRLLEAIDASKLGFVAIIADDGTLRGIVTDGDVRRAALRHIDNLSELLKTDMINRNPLTVTDNATIAEMLRQVCQAPRPVLFLPVVDKSLKLVGVVSFNEIVKGES
jgi:ribulose-phosphate 3-epimerase